MVVCSIQVTRCRSKLFAQRLFECLDADNSGDISLEELLDVMHILQSRNSEKRIAFIFKLFDLDGDGVLSSEELSSVLKASVMESDVSVTPEEEDSLIEALTNLFDENRDGVVSYSEFYSVLVDYPDILEGLSLEGVHCQRAPDSQNKTNTKTLQGKNPIWSWLSNNPQVCFTYGVTVLAVIVSFVWRFSLYTRVCGEVSSPSNSQSYFCSNVKKRELMGWSLPLAKGCGQAMKVVFMLVLFPVSRHTMTHFRNTFLSNFLCFDGAIAYHRFLGKLGLALAWIHTISHVFNMVRLSDSAREDQFKEAYGSPENTTSNDVQQPNMVELLRSTNCLTGISLITIYSLASLFALDYPRQCKIFYKRPNSTEGVEGFIGASFFSIGKILNNFNNFWYTHQSFALFYACMIFHPFPSIPKEDNQWTGDIWIWVVTPVAIYVIEKIFRSLRFRASSSKVLSTEVFSGNVVSLKISKPPSFGYVAGQYVFLNCPQISLFEWHPFTLASSPGDSYVQVYIRVCGDWTNALLKLVNLSSDVMEQGKCRLTSDEEAPFQPRRQSVLLKAVSGSIEEVIPSCPFVIRIDGPFGAPAQNYKEYQTLLLIGAGIGVTPFASVLNDMLDTMKQHKCLRCGLASIPKGVKTRKIYFFWSVRSRKEASWFKHVLEAISHEDEEDLIEINIHITSIRNAKDVRCMMFRLAQTKNKETMGYDPVSMMKTRAITHFGRPKWNEVFAMVKQSHPKDKSIGVFYCGPSGLGHTIRKQCKSCTNEKIKFDFHKEIF